MLNDLFAVLLIVVEKVVAFQTKHAQESGRDFQIDDFLYFVNLVFWRNFTDFLICKIVFESFKS